MQGNILADTSRDNLIRLLHDLQRHTYRQGNRVRLYAVSMAIADYATILATIIGRIYLYRPVRGLRARTTGIVPSCSRGVFPLPLVAQTIAFRGHMEGHGFSVLSRDVLRLLDDPQLRHLQCRNAGDYALTMAIRNHALVLPPLIGCGHRERPVRSLRARTTGIVPIGSFGCLILPLIAQTIAIRRYVQGNILADTSRDVLRLLDDPQHSQSCCINFLNNFKLLHFSLNRLKAHDRKQIITVATNGIVIL